MLRWHCCHLPLRWLRCHSPVALVTLVTSTALVFIALTLPLFDVVNNTCKGAIAFNAVAPLLTACWCCPVACCSPQHDGAIAHIALALSSCLSLHSLQRLHGPCCKGAVAHVTLATFSFVFALATLSSAGHSCCAGGINCTGVCRIGIVIHIVVAVAHSAMVPLTSMQWPHCPHRNGTVDHVTLTLFSCPTLPSTQCAVRPPDTSMAPAAAFV